MEPLGPSRFACPCKVDARQAVIHRSIGLVDWNRSEGALRPASQRLPYGKLRSIRPCRSLRVPYCSAWPFFWLLEQHTPPAPSQLWLRAASRLTLRASSPRRASTPRCWFEACGTPIDREYRLQAPHQAAPPPAFSRLFAARSKPCTPQIPPFCPALPTRERPRGPRPSRPEREPAVVGQPEGALCLRCLPLRTRSRVATCRAACPSCAALPKPTACRPTEMPAAHALTPHRPTPAASVAPLSRWVRCGHGLHAVKHDGA